MSSKAHKKGLIKAEKVIIGSHMVQCYCPFDLNHSTLHINTLINLHCHLCHVSYADDEFISILPRLFRNPEVKKKNRRVLNYR